MNDSAHPERRKYLRVNKHFILSYYDLNDPLVRHNASQLKNISVGGMCLITSKQFTPGTNLGIEVKTPLVFEFIDLKGTVLESKAKIVNIIYETRVQFNEVPPNVLSVLKKLIEYFDHEGHEKGQGHHE